jgi:hypothetical protein
MKNYSSKLLVLLAFSLLASFAFAKGPKVTLKGYLMDKQCSARVMKSESPMAKARKHTKECAEECEAGGFGLVSEDKYYLFDQKGNDLVSNLLKTTTRTDALGLEVVGTVEGDKLLVESIKEIDLDAGAAK